MNIVDPEFDPLDQLVKQGELLIQLSNSHNQLAQAHEKLVKELRFLINGLQKDNQLLCQKLQQLENSISKLQTQLQQ